MHHLHLFLSSPGDVNRERQLAHEVIDQIQSERLYRDRLKLEVVAWDKPVTGNTMAAHLEPRKAIALGLKKPSQCDIVIVICWARMGTPLSDKHFKPDGNRYRSGTEYEFLDALNARRNTDKPDVLVYRRKKPPDVNLADPNRMEKLKQWDLVEEFFAEFRNSDGSYRSYFQEYDEPSDFKYLLEQNLRDLITQYLEAHPPDKAEFPVSTVESTWEESPFPGLRAFSPKEAILFSGRGREMDALISKLSESSCRFMAVVGTSGTGKSSLVAAGVLPALEKAAIPGSRDWILLRFTPGEVGDNPFMALANAFKPMIERHGHLPRDIAKKLETYPEVLNEFLTMALEGKPEWAELLLFIDQFEELFTIVDSKYRHAFIDLLAVAAKTARLRTVMTMRVDFYHSCLEWPVLDTLLAEGVYTLLAPKTGALHEMITRPAKLAGLRFEEGLEERILDDTGMEPGALALLAFALYELWQKSKGADGVLTHADYESFNGVHGAIGKRAEDTFNRLIEENEGKRSIYETALARVFRELVEVDERGVATRRRAQLSQVTEETDAEPLVKALIEARLLTSGLGDDQEPIVEVAHEAIFTNWPRLRQWIEDTRDDLRLLNQLRLAASYWDQRGRADIFLWSIERFSLARGMIDRLRPQLSEQQLMFMNSVSELVNRLLIELDDPDTPHGTRVLTGNQLSAIGDTRLGVGLNYDGLPSIDWCDVPGGEIAVMNTKEPLQVKPLQIAKFPVTYLQYRSFVEAEDGYRNIKWWLEVAHHEDEPGEQYRKLDNHPAENVSWFDAFAFCRWLSAKLGYEVRLPTEWEWQQAATGGDLTKVYPWSEEWDALCANTRENRILHTMAVGMYPQGASPLGILDMSGNIWEWCLNKFWNSAGYNVHGHEPRSIRGGSWINNREMARTAHRQDAHSRSRSNLLGFRLARIS